MNARSDPDPRWRPDTRAVVAGRDLSPGAPLNVPPVLASTFRDGGPLMYGRFGNPTAHALEEALGALEGGRAVAFSSGQAATAAVLGTLRAGATVVHPAGSYSGTRALLGALEDAGVLGRREVDVTDSDAVCRALVGADLVWLESPTNPMLGIADLPLLLAEAARLGVPAVVDNTFATPLLQRPLGWGAAAVVHSATKYLGGHSDLLLGLVVTADDALAGALVSQRTLRGAVPGALDAYLALRGLRTLAVRLARQQESAGVLARRLEGHRAVRRVHYPGLESDPFCARAAAQMDGFGAIVSFELATAADADRLTESVTLVVPTTSFGGVETTIERRGRWQGEERLPPGLLRMSVGLEHVEDIWDDLAQALARVAP